MSQSECSHDSPKVNRKHKDHPKSYALPDKKSLEKLKENGRKHRRHERKRNLGTKDFSPVTSGEIRDLHILGDMKDHLIDIEKKVVETRKRSNIDPKAEEERLVRQKWMEEKKIKDEVTRRFEIYLQKRVQSLLIEKEMEVTQVVKERVQKAQERIERERQEAEKIHKEELKREQNLKLEEEVRQREQLLRLEQENLHRQNEAKRKEEMERTQRLTEDLRQLEEKHRRETEEQKKRKREQELILNKNRSRAKLSFSLKK